jgi:hypothetical protein
MDYPSSGGDITGTVRAEISFRIQKHYISDRADSRERPALISKVSFYSGFMLLTHVYRSMLKGVGKKKSFLLGISWNQTRNSS